MDEEMIKINQEIEKIGKIKGENYGEVSRCVIFHENILK
jgi:hypothetical protein